MWLRPPWALYRPLRLATCGPPLLSSTPAPLLSAARSEGVVAAGPVAVADSASTLAARAAVRAGAAAVGCGHALCAARLGSTRQQGSRAPARRRGRRAKRSSVGGRLEHSGERAAAAVAAVSADLLGGRRADGPRYALGAARLGSTRQQGSRAPARRRGRRAKRSILNSIVVASGSSTPCATRRGGASQLFTLRDASIKGPHKATHGPRRSHIPAPPPHGGQTLHHKVMQAWGTHRGGASQPCTYFGFAAARRQLVIYAPR